MSASREKKTRQEKDPSILDPKTAREAAERKKQKRSDRMYAAIFIAFLLVAAIVVTWNSGILQKRATAVTISRMMSARMMMMTFCQTGMRRFLGFLPPPRGGSLGGRREPEEVPLLRRRSRP